MSPILEKAILHTENLLQALKIKPTDPNDIFLVVFDEPGYTLHLSFLKSKLNCLQELQKLNIKRPNPYLPELNTITDCENELKRIGVLQKLKHPLIADIDAIHQEISEIKKKLAVLIDVESLSVFKDLLAGKKAIQEINTTSFGQTIKESIKKKITDIDTKLSRIENSLEIQRLLKKQNMLVSTGAKLITKELEKK